MGLNEEMSPDEQIVSQMVIRELAKLREDVSDLREELKAAVPSGDIDSHRRYHELIIEHTAQRVRLRHAVIEKTLTGLVYMGLLALGAAVWQYFISAISNAKH